MLRRQKYAYVTYDVTWHCAEQKTASCLVETEPKNENYRGLKGRPLQRLPQYQSSTLYSAGIPGASLFVPPEDLKV